MHFVTHTHTHIHHRYSHYQVEFTTGEFSQKNELSKEFPEISDLLELLKRHLIHKTGTMRIEYFLLF